jgi:hypothetical protein
MPKSRIETGPQYQARITVPQEKFGYISGSTTATGILGYTHSLGTAPRYASATYHGTSPYFITTTAIGENTVDFKVWNTVPSGSAVVSGAVTASFLLKL